MVVSLKSCTSVVRNAFYQGFIWVVLENLPQYWVGFYEERMQQFSFRESCMRRCQENQCARQELGPNANHEVVLKYVMVYVERTS